MPDTLQRLDQKQVSELAVSVRNAGIAGAGGAGFPSYAKWERIDEVDALLVNHQESEPNYYIDKWLGQERAEELVVLFDALLESTLDLVVVGAKEAKRDPWMRELERLADATVYGPADLPVDSDEESGIVFAYTEDRYQFGMESVLLNMVADTVIGRDLPMDHGWIVQNTETLLAIHDALVRSKPMTSKYVHVDGTGTRHRFLEVPIGTPGTDLLEAGGLSASDLPDDAVLADGGPGWCFEIGEEPADFGVRKRTNCLLVLDEETVEEHTLGNDRIDVQDAREWTEGEHEQAPSETLTPDVVHVPLITNPAFEGIVQPSRPIVEAGDRVSTGEMIAVPATEGISNPEHASIDGEVTKVTDRHVTIERVDDARAEGRTAVIEATDRIYSTWCQECGEYVIPDETVVDPTTYVCEECAKG